MLPLGIDYGDKVRKAHVALACDLFQPLPECILEADAGLMSSDYNRAFDDLRFHRLSLSFYPMAVTNGVGCWLLGAADSRGEDIAAYPCRTTSESGHQAHLFGSQRLAVWLTSKASAQSRRP